MYKADACILQASAFSVVEIQMQMCLMDSSIGLRFTRK